MGGTVPGGQHESGLLVIQESRMLQGETRKIKEIALFMSDDIERLNFCFATASLTDDESLLHLFKLTCQDQNAKA